MAKFVVASAIRFLFISVSIVALLMSTGCGLDSRVDTLQQQIKQTNKDLGDLKKDVRTLQNQRNWDNVAKDSGKVAFLTPGDGGYSVLNTDFGTLTVTLVDIKPYAIGSRVVLRFGNPTAATLTDVSASVDWGSVDDKGLANNDSEKIERSSFY